MWYFVERNGRAVAKAKTLFGAQLKCVEKVEAGDDPTHLHIVDICGREYPKAGCLSINPFLPKNK